MEEGGGTEEGGWKEGGGREGGRWMEGVAGAHTKVTQPSTWGTLKNIYT